MATNNHTVCLDDFVHASLCNSTGLGWVGSEKKKRRFDPTRHDRPDPTRPDPTPTPTTTSTQPRPDPTKPDTAEALDQTTRPNLDPGPTPAPTSTRPRPDLDQTRPTAGQPAVLAKDEGDTKAKE